MDYQEITKEVADYCERTGLAVATVCDKATRNSRLLDGMKSKQKRLERDAKALREWMAANPKGISK